MIKRRKEKKSSRVADLTDHQFPLSIDTDQDLIVLGSVLEELKVPELLHSVPDYQKHKSEKKEIPHACLGPHAERKDQIISKFANGGLEMLSVASVCE